MENIYLLPIIGEIGKDFKYTDLLMHLNAAKDSSTIHIVIGSPGGYIDDGLKIRDALLSCGKIIMASNSGDVASIAVSIFLTAPKGLRSFDPSKGVFLIHNPLIQPEDLTATAYNAEDFAMMSKDLKGFENDLAKQYVQATGSNIDILKAFMAENTPLTPDQISALGFATIEQPAFKAVALIHTKKQEMENKEVIEKFGKFETLLDKIHKKLFAKNLMLQDVNGVEIDFGDAVQTPEQIVVGVKGMVDGKPAEGDITMADGSILSFKAGVLEKITPKVAEDVEALKAENEALKLKLSEGIAAQNKLQVEFDSFKAEAQKEINTAKTEFTAFKNLYSKTPPLGNTPPEGKEKIIADKEAHRKEFGL
jgi:ATP-dependent protease ClpP protease subunit